MRAPAVFGMMFIGFNAIVGFCGLSAGRSHTVKEINEGRYCFAEVRVICAPVVHLEVYVYMIVTTPRRTIALVPHALKVSGERACS